MRAKASQGGCSYVGGARDTPDAISRPDPSTFEIEGASGRRADEITGAGS